MFLGIRIIYIYKYISYNPERGTEALRYARLLNTSICDSVESHFVIFFEELCSGVGARCLDFHVVHKITTSQFLILSKAFGDIAHIANRCRSDLGALFLLFFQWPMKEMSFVAPARSMQAA